MLEVFTLRVYTLPPLPIGKKAFQFFFIKNVSFDIFHFCIKKVPIGIPCPPPLPIGKKALQFFL